MNLKLKPFGLSFFCLKSFSNDLPFRRFQNGCAKKQRLTSIEVSLVGL
jgi:hypothetical protein